ncbi:MAG: type II secretion system protein GspG [Bacteroidota bacterium]
MSILEDFLGLLADIGLCHEDWKHRRKIEKKERIDGKKRPFQKHILKPSVIICLGLFFTITTILFSILAYRDNSVNPIKTKTEIKAMNQRLEEWHRHFGYYPSTMEELIGNSPIRQEWKKDAWKRPYKYVLTNERTEFLIISAGKDGVFDTKDDITSD